MATTNFAKKANKFSEKFIAQNMSVFIPHVHDSVNFEKVAHTFKSLDLGVVSRIEWIPKTNSLVGTTYKSCFVFFQEWYNTTASVNLRNKITDLKRNVKLVYDEPHYWNLCENSSEVSTYPENIHYDLDLCVPNTTSFEEVKTFLVELDLGHINGLTVTSDKEDYITEYSRTVKCPGNWKNIVNEDDWKGYMFPGHMSIKVNFDYWYRTITAVKFQEEMAKNMDDGLYFPISFNTIWKVTVSSTPSNSDGRNPYVWYNTGVDTVSPSNTQDAIDNMIYELETINNKLNTFAYTTSYDLKLDNMTFNYHKTMLEILNDEHPEYNIKSRIENIIN